MSTNIQTQEFLYIHLKIIEYRKDILKKRNASSKTIPHYKTPTTIAKSLIHRAASLSAEVNICGEYFKQKNKMETWLRRQKREKSKNKPTNAYKYIVHVLRVSICKTIH